MRPTPVLAALVLAGCSLGADPLAPPPLGTESPPDLVRLAPKIQSTFGSAKLTGNPRVSRIRRAPVSALGDWIVCLRGSDPEDSRVYAVIMSGSEVVDYRLALMIDGCANESFGPLPGAPPIKK
jgi:hypothetical protein